MTTARATLALATIALFVGLAPGVAAHATPVSSLPAPGGQLASAPSEIWIEFSQEPDPTHTRITLTDGAGALVAVGEPLVVGARVTVPVSDLADGGYVLRWEVLSEIDGHVTKGAWGFVIGSGAAPDVLENEGADLRVEAVVGKALSFMGLALVAGVVAMRLGVLPTALHDKRWSLVHRVAVAGALVQLGGLALFAVSQAGLADSGLVSYLSSTAFGRGLALRLVLAGVLVPLVLVDKRNLQRWDEAIEAAAVLAILLVYAAFSHTTAFARWAVVGIALDLGHLAAALSWAGALVLLWLLLRGRAGPLVEEERLLAVRFSRFATGAIIVAALTGTLMTAQLAGWSLAGVRAMLASDHGLWLLLKINLVVPMLALGAINRYAFIARYQRGDGLDTRDGLARNVRREAGIGMAIILVAGIVTNLSPASLGGPTDGGATAPQADQPLLLEAFGSTYGFHLLFDPAPSTFVNTTLTIHVFENGTGASVENAIRLFVTFTPDDPDQGATRLLARDTGNGTFVVAGSFFTQAGAWSLDLRLQTPEVYAEDVSVRFTVG